MRQINGWKTKTSYPESRTHYFVPFEVNRCLQLRFGAVGQSDMIEVLNLKGRV